MHMEYSIRRASVSNATSDAMFYVTPFTHGYSHNVPIIINIKVYVHIYTNDVNEPLFVRTEELLLHSIQSPA